MSRNLGIVEQLAESTPSVVDELFRHVTAFGDPLFIILAAFVLAVIWDGRYIHVGVAAGGAIVVAWVLKLVLQVPRPPTADIGGFGFPSVHATGAVALFVGLAWFVDDLPASVRVLSVGVAALVVVSRVVLGVHYTLDVLGGAGIGLAAVLYLAAGQSK